MTDERGGQRMVPVAPGGAERSAARERVAVVGSGVAGLTAAYVLQRRYDVLLFEADDRLGGHAHTHELADPRAGALAVDSEFIVHNERTYPNLLRLFAELGVATQETEMSMSVRCLGCGLEYTGAKGPRGVFARPGNARNPRFLRMLGEIKRFHRHARRLLARPACPPSAAGTGLREAVVGATLGEFVGQGGYSRYFVDHFLIPLVSAVWSTGPELDRRAQHEHAASFAFARTRNHTVFPSAATFSTITASNCGNSASIPCDMHAGHSGRQPPRTRARHADQPDHVISARALNRVHSKFRADGVRGPGEVCIRKARVFFGQGSEDGGGCLVRGLCIGEGLVARSM